MNAVIKDGDGYDIVTIQNPTVLPRVGEFVYSPNDKKLLKVLKVVWFFTKGEEIVVYCD